MASISEIRKNLRNIERSFIRSTSVMTHSQWCDYVLDDVEAMEATAYCEENPISMRLLDGERMLC